MSKTDPTLPTISENVAVARSPPEKNEEDEELDSSPLWNKEEEGWELTWPIWHMLPRDERKQLANKHGYKTIGEFEEYMSLQQAVDNSGVKLPIPYDNELIYPRDLKDKQEEKPTVQPKNKMNEEDDDDDESSTDQEREYNRQLSSSKTEEDLSDIIKLGGKILILHDELLHKVFSYLPVDSYGSLALVSPHWKHLTRTEAVYRRLCERLYLQQSKRKQLHLSKFGGKYRTMLEQRPRVRAAGGCYVLKYSQIKKIQRDMWTEIPVGAILEAVYYRYFYFQEDGRVLYALSSTPPHEMFRRLLKVCLKKKDDKAAVWGTFQVQKDILIVTARQEWHSVKFKLTISSDKISGKFGLLTLDEHQSSPSGCFDYYSNDLVDYNVPEGYFRFVRDRRL